MTRELEPALHAILTHYADFWEENVSPFFDKLYTRSGLDKKTQELIVTWLLALRGWENGRADARLAGTGSRRHTRECAEPPWSRLALEE